MNAAFDFFYGHPVLVVAGYLLCLAGLIVGGAALTAWLVTRSREWEDVRRFNNTRAGLHRASRRRP